MIPVPTRESAKLRRSIAAVKKAASGLSAKPGALSTDLRQGLVGVRDAILTALDDLDNAEAAAREAAREAYHIKDEAA